MEKKNTILLTMIAVATLLITVVGATFAYFGVTLQNDSETVSISGSATDVGVVTVSSPDAAIYLNLTGKEMSKDNAEKWYFATPTNDLDYVSVNVNEVTEENKEVVWKTLEENAVAEIFNVSVVGGDNTLTYTCDTSFSISITEKDTLINAIDGRAEIGIFFRNPDNFSMPYEFDTSAESFAMLYDLVELKNGPILIEGKIPNLSINEPLSTYVMLFVENENYEQNFANTILDLEIKADSISCKINK